MQLHTCPLCGYEFDATGLACHTSCPLGRHCTIICCPNCGYQMPDDERAGIAGKLKRAWERLQARHQDATEGLPNGARPVTALHVGAHAEITEIVSNEARRLNHLGTLGLVPGSTLRLLQRDPAYVVAVDETEVALDESVAREIMVRVGVEAAEPTGGE